MLKEMTAAQYAKKRKITSAAIYMAVKRGTALPAVTSIKHFPRFYLLEVDTKALSDFMRLQKQRRENKMT